jgi:hypothetical protein
MTPPDQLRIPKTPLAGVTIPSTIFAITTLTLVLLITIYVLKFRQSHQKPSPIPQIHALSLSAIHSFTKTSTKSLTLLQGLGIKGDAHMGATVQHLSRLKLQPNRPNERQVHLLDLATLRAHDLQPGAIGENITTEGIDLLGLGRGTRLRFVPSNEPESEKGIEALDAKGSAKAPCIVITGLRNPCPQIEKYRAGLQEVFVERDEQRRITARKAGIMAVVETGGEIEVGMRIIVERPDTHVKLDVV